MKKVTTTIVQAEFEPGDLIQFTVEHGSHYVGQLVILREDGREDEFLMDGAKSQLSYASKSWLNALYQCGNIVFLTNLGNTEGPKWR